MLRISWLGVPEPLPPGAARCTAAGPRFENEASVSDFVEAATQTTFGTLKPCGAGRWYSHG